MLFAKNVKEANAILIGFPDKNDAPAEIRKGFDNFYFPENRKENKLYDFSDFLKEEIEKKILRLLKFKKKIISIGGGHSITVPIVRAFSKVYKKFGVLFLDAHPDCQKGYSPSWDVVPKIIEIGIPIVIIGVRNWSKDEYNFLIKNKIPFLQAKDFTIRKAITLIRKYLPKKVYISFDIDVVDPAFAPAANYIEPGGISSREIINFLHKLCKSFEVIGFDLVEINPSKDINYLTLNLSAKIIFEIID